MARLRRERNWTLEDLADEAGLHRTHIGLVERGERKLSLLAAHSIAAAFGFRLSELIELAEDDLAAEETTGRHPPRRSVDPACLMNGEFIRETTGLDERWIAAAIEGAYQTLDAIDLRLAEIQSPPLSRLVELANLSSMLGNLLGAALATASEGAYERNRPHAYPDLVPQRDGLPPAELKTALEKNKPKGHLPKPGLHLTFRYVLGDADGNYVRGRDGRGEVVWIWEARMGFLEVDDFSVSNTPGDSGKTAVIKTASLDRLACVFFNPTHDPHVRRRGRGRLA
jgi:transcriptional regulator with XRE-family HTH domain